MGGRTSSSAYPSATQGENAPRIEVDMEDKSRPLNVIIVGAGIGGLMAAIGLRENGHKVKIFEQSRFANEVGAAIVIAPNATAILRRYGFEPETRGAVVCERMTALNPDGTIIYDCDTAFTRNISYHPWQLIHRVDLHNKLKEMALDPDRKGTPVEIHLSSRVAGVDTKTGTVVLKNDEKHRGDVVIGADGVHSVLRPAVVGGEFETEASGKRAFRFLIPKEKLADDPEVKRFIEHQGTLMVWVGVDRKVVSYPCRGGNLLNFACIAPDVPENQTGTGWDNAATLEDLLEAYKHFHPAVLAMLHKIDPKEIKVWRLLDAPALKTWVDGKVALLGDAAHPFLPHQGQGGAQALEDAAALAVVLPLGTKPEEINERLKLYEDIRFERASIVQEYTRQAGMDLDEKPFLDIREFFTYNFNHDAYDNATKHFNEYLLRKNPTLYQRMPISFGPFPGSHQDYYGNRRNTSETGFVRAKVTFTTPKMYLDTLLPTSRFRIDVPGTIAKISFVYTKFSNLDWLGGRGYSHFGVYIHDVTCIGDSEEVCGMFLIVQFQNLADLVLSGRDEFGFPQLFATLKEELSGGNFTAKAGWEENVFSSLEITGLKEDQNDPAVENGGGKETGVLHYKYIPKTGAPGEADVAYPTFSPFSNSTETKVEKTLAGGKASVKFDKKDWKALPTLHHVVAGLQGIVVRDLLQAKVELGRGCADLGAPRRIT